MSYCTIRRDEIDSSLSPDTYISAVACALNLTLENSLMWSQPPRTATYHSSFSAQPNTVVLVSRAAGKPQVTMINFNAIIVAVVTGGMWHKISLAFHPS